MRLVIARCSVDYVGRLDAHLPMADRLLIVKADGSVSVHADDRAYKPLNWMTPPCTLKESAIEDLDGDDTGEVLWLVENPKGEQLRITIAEIHEEISYDMGEDPGLVKDGVEAHLQELLADQIDTLGDSYTLVRREYPTAIGPVDIMAKDENNNNVAIEVKRRGDVRRAKLYYLRDRRGKSARIAEVTNYKPKADKAAVSASSNANANA